MEEREGYSPVLEGILISLGLPRRQDGGEQRWRLWEHRAQEKRTGNKRERSREKAREEGEGHTPTGNAHCARSKYAAPNKTSSHETMGGCVWLWDATNAMQACRHTHTK